MRLLREGVLEGRGVALAGGLSPGVTQALRALGARVEELEQALDEEKVGAWARDRLPLHSLIYGASEEFSGGGTAGLVATLRAAWGAVREVALGALIEAEAPGQVILLAPARAAGPGAEAARSALENLARTLSVEWARHRVSTVTVAPGPATTESQLADLVCFLCSPAGAYFSGCRIDLGALG